MVIVQIGSDAKVSRVLRGSRLQLPPALYIEGRVSGDRTRLRLFLSRYLLLAAQAKSFPSGLLLVLGVMLMGFPYRASSRSTSYWAAPYRFIVGRLLGTPTSVAPECLRES